MILHHNFFYALKFAPTQKNSVLRNEEFGAWQRFGPRRHAGFEERMPDLCDERRLSPPRPNQEHMLKLLKLEPFGRPEPFERLALPLDIYGWLIVLVRVDVWRPVRCMSRAIPKPPTNNPGCSMYYTLCPLLT